MCGMRRKGTPFNRWRVSSKGQDSYRAADGLAAPAGRDPGDGSPCNGFRACKGCSPQLHDVALAAQGAKPACGAGGLRRPAPGARPAPAAYFLLVLVDFALVLGAAFVGAAVVAGAASIFDLAKAK